MSEPRASPPRFAAPATEVANTGLSFGRAIARSSPRWAVAVADRMPMLTPLTARAAMSPAVSGQSRNITAEAIEIPTAMTCIGRRPSQSLTWPNRYRLSITPTANAE